MDDLMRNALIKTHRGTRSRPARPSRVALGLGRALRHARDSRAVVLVRHNSRWALGSAVVGGSIASLVLGMTIGGAFNGVDVALPPAGSGQASPRIEYAAPGGSHARDAGGSHPATAAHSATTTTGAPKAPAGSGQGPTTTDGATPTTTPTTAPSGSGSGSSGSGSTPTTVPATPTTTPSTTVPSPTTTVPSGPIHKIFG